MLRAVPYRFTPQVVRRVVTPRRAGVYILGNDVHGFAGGYVGRSDSCLQNRLATHNHLYKFDYFIFRYATSVQQAYRLECQFWHTYEHGMEVENRIHPAAPRGSGSCCPYCEFAANTVMLLAA